MRRLLSLFLPFMALVIMLAAVAPVSGASSGVQDDGHFFKEETVTQANSLIHQIQTDDDRNVLVVTYEGIPDNLLDEYKSKEQGKERNDFFNKWANEVGKKNGVSGIVILLTRDPGHLQVAVGNKTRQQSFTDSDRDQLDKQMLASLKNKDFDGALLDGLRFIKTQMDQHPSRGGVAQGSTSSSGTTSGPGTTGYSTPAPQSSSPGSVVTKSSGLPIGGLLCAGVAILVIVVVVISKASGNRGYGGQGGMPPAGGYPPGTYGGGGNYPQQGGGYPQGGGNYGAPGGGGGGFGRGMLGGLLGGAVGAWGYDKLTGRGGNAGVPPIAGGGSSGGGGDFGSGGSSNQADTNFSSTGGDFNSSSSTGGDFNSSSSDSGGGSDFGSSTGGDFGGGGGDSGGGGGGDSGGGGGGDF